MLYSTRIYFIPASIEALTVARKFPDCKKSEYVSTGTKDHETLPLTNVQGMTVMILAQDILLVTNHGPLCTHSDTEYVIQETTIMTGY